MNSSKIILIKTKFSKYNPIKVLTHDTPDTLRNPHVSFDLTELQGDSQP